MEAAVIWWLLAGVLIGVFVAAVGGIIWLAWYLKDLWG